MIHKHIGGKKNQRSVKNSLDYLLRTNKPEEQKFVEILSQTNRSDIENFFDTKVNLQVWVKVKEDWRNRAGLLKNFGFDEKNFNM